MTFISVIQSFISLFLPSWAIIAHWLVTVPGVITMLFILYFCIIINPFLWIPVLIYCIVIQVKLPSTKEVDYWSNIKNKYISKNGLDGSKYKKNFEVQFENKEFLTGPQIFAFHPHGLQSISHFIHKLNEESELYPFLSKAKSAVHPILFRFPILREGLMAFGCIPATRKYISYYLDNNISVCITPGGIHEIKLCTVNNTSIQTDTSYFRNGFIELGKKWKVTPINIKGEQDFFTINSYNCKEINDFLSAISGRSVDVNILQGCQPRNIWRWMSLWFQKENIKLVAHVGVPEYITTVEEYTKRLF